MQPMTLAQLAQLYAPLAGLLILAAWTGALAQRVKTLEDEKAARVAADAKRQETDRANAKDEGSLREDFIELRTTYRLNGESVSKQLDEMKRENKSNMDGVRRELSVIARQIANSMKTPIKEFSPADGDAP